MHPYVLISVPGCPVIGSIQYSSEHGDTAQTVPHHRHIYNCLYIHGCVSTLRHPVHTEVSTIILFRHPFKNRIACFDSSVSAFMEGFDIGGEVPNLDTHFLWC